MKHIAFIIHGKIKKHDKIVAAIKALFSDTANLSFSVTQHANHAGELAHNAIVNGATHIICLGGDGSLNEVVNGIMQAKSNSENTVQVGLLPHGTGNDFARRRKTGAQRWQIGLRYLLVVDGRERGAGGSVSGGAW